ncbi:MAG TPA: hypothetical protein VNF75_01505 [Candidatus Dormibacteraeota bacterium]|nr:hypothetical protein [Candidatus Dormibacteraeota bacterium]
MSATRPDPGDPRPATFQGWQRGACISGVILLVVFAILLMVGMTVGVLGIH